MHDNHGTDFGAPYVHETQHEANVNNWNEKVAEAIKEALDHRDYDWARTLSKQFLKI